MLQPPTIPLPDPNITSQTALINSTVCAIKMFLQLDNRFFPIIWTSACTCTLTSLNVILLDER